MGTRTTFFPPSQCCRGSRTDVNALLSPPGQPQVRAAPQPPGPCTHLLQNGAGRGPDPGGALGDAGNGVFRPLPSSQKPHRKLQSHHSINSQSSKKSKGSSKSASSHIPIEAQEGTGSPQGGPFPAGFLQPHIPWGFSCSTLPAHGDPGCQPCSPPGTLLRLYLLLFPRVGADRVISYPPKSVSSGVWACPRQQNWCPGIEAGP